MSSDEAGAATPGAARRRPSRGAMLWLTVILLVGIVQLGRGQWGDAALFAVAAGVVLVSALTPTSGRPAGIAMLPLVAGAAVPAVVLSVVPRHSAWSAIAVITAGIAAAAVAWRVPGERTAPAASRWTPALRALAWSWAIVIVVACLWELLQVTRGRTLPGGRAAYPALSDLLDPLMTPPVGQAIFAVGWLAVGIFLVRRGATRR
ncbi:hypothetical protein P0L94_14240 [Microbacter sp. GSS18]|nr:hypothetical protein P0L94_14240 [Microbacter sp. GSS18]